MAKQRSVPEFLAVGSRDTVLQAGSVKGGVRGIIFSAKSVTKTLDHNKLREAFEVTQSGHRLLCSSGFQRFHEVPSGGRPDVSGVPGIGPHRV